VSTKKTEGFALNLGALFAEVERERVLEDKFLATTPKVVVRTPSLANRRDKRYRVERLGNLRAFEITTTGPRGGQETRRHVDGGAGGWNWRDCDVRLADDALLAKLADIDAKVKALQDERAAYIRDRFLELTPLTWDEVRDGRKPWAEFQRLYSLAKKGGATVDEVRSALDRLLGAKTEANE